MKRTTYIMIGMLLAGLVVISGMIFYSVGHGTTWEDTFMEIGGKQKTVQLPECKSVEFVLIRTDEDAPASFTDLPLVVSPTNATNGSLTIAADLEQYMTLRKADDVLWIEFRFPAQKMGSHYNKQNWLRIRSAAMQLNLPAEVQLVGADIMDLRGTFRGFRCDTLSVWMSDYAELEDCRITSLYVAGREFYLKSGEVHNLYLNLDACRSWNVNTESFHIDTEYLMGSGEHHCKLQKGESRRVFWMPLKEDATLNLKLEQAATIEVN